jgi:hypothetical protein
VGIGEQGVRSVNNVAAARTIERTDYQVMGKNEHSLDLGILLAQCKLRASIHQCRVATARAYASMPLSMINLHDGMLNDIHVLHNLGTCKQTQLVISTVQNIITFIIN